jgi:ferrous-iron efflux pump FieF
VALTASSPSRALSIAIAATLALGLVKLVGAALTGSRAVLASAVDSLADAGVSLLNLLLARAAQRPADVDHPFGHGKAEAIAALLQGAALAVTTVGLAWGAVVSLGSAEAAPQTGAAVAAMTVSLVGSLLISRHLRRAADATGSLVLRADAAHYQADLWSGGAVVVGLVAVRLTGASWPDALATLLVCGLIGRDVVGLVRGAVDELMDRALPDEDVAAARQVLAGMGDRVRGVHGLRGRRVGPVTFLEVHVELDGDLPFREAHAISDDVENALRARFAPADVIVHADVEDDGPPRTR